MTPTEELELQDAKEEAYITAVEEIEGHVPSIVESQTFGGILREPKRPNEEMVLWRGKRILHFKWSARNGELKTLVLYKTK